MKIDLFWVRLGILLTALLLWIPFGFFVRGLAILFWIGWNAGGRFWD